MTSCSFRTPIPYNTPHTSFHTLVLCQDHPLLLLPIHYNTHAHSISNPCWISRRSNEGRAWTHNQNQFVQALIDTGLSFPHFRWWTGFETMAAAGFLRRLGLSRVKNHLWTSVCLLTIGTTVINFEEILMACQDTFPDVPYRSTSG